MALALAATSTPGRAGPADVSCVFLALACEPSLPPPFPYDPPVLLDAPVEPEPVVRRHRRHRHRAPPHRATDTRFGPPPSRPPTPQ